MTAAPHNGKEADFQLFIELLRVRFDEQARNEKRKTAGTAIEGTGGGDLKPWREVVTPHADVASGRYQQAEFAADLWQVHLGEQTDEYRDPAGFFRRTPVRSPVRQGADAPRSPGTRLPEPTLNTCQSPGRINPPSYLMAGSSPYITSDSMCSWKKLSLL
jgi:hypothetical protein